MAEQGIRSRRSLLLGFLLGVVFVAAGVLELRQLNAWRLRTAAVRRTALREAYRLSRFPADYRAAFEANHPHALGRLLTRAQSLMAGANALQSREASADPALKALISQLGQVRPLLAEAVARTAAARGPLEKTFQSVHAARIALPLYRLSARRLADRLESVGASVSQVLPASRLADEASRLNRRLAAFGRPHTLFRRYADGLRRRARKMEEVTRGLAVGSRRLGLPPVRDPAFSPALRSLSALFAPVARGVGLIVGQGKVLDPIADRVLLATAVIGILAAGAVPIPVAVIALTREGLVAVAAAGLALAGARRIDVTLVGKAGTFGLMCAFPLFLAGHSTIGWHRAALLLAWAAAIIGLVLGWVSVVLYAPLARAALTDRRAAAAGDRDASTL